MDYQFSKFRLENKSRLIETNMKIFITILAIAAFIACASAAALPEEIYDGSNYEIIVPVDEKEADERAFHEEESHEHESDDEEEESDKDDEESDEDDESIKDEEPPALKPHIRRRRFTCDVFSFSSKWVTPNHAACALKCVGKGRKGGHCEGQNCKCRDGSWIH